MSGAERPCAGVAAIDHAGGIARLMGDSALFARVLARFRSEYRDAAAGIRLALDNGDRVLALRLAHTLHGAAGMIEAHALKTAARTLEQSLRNGAEVPHARLAQLEHALDQVLRELDATPASRAPARSTASAAPAPAGLAVVVRLFSLLDDGNGDAVDLVREAEAALRMELGDQSFDRLAAAVESFDFDAALAMLEERAA